jgi:hypothetical protein
MLIEVPLMCQQRITVTAATVEAARGPGNFAYSLFGRHVPRRDGRRRLWNSRAIAFVDSTARQIPAWWRTLFCVYEIYYVPIGFRSQSSVVQAVEAMPSA